MTGFVLLDVAIGVIFTLLAFSLVASSVQEALAAVLNWRGRILRRGLLRLLEGGDKDSDLVSTTFFEKGTAEKAKLTAAFLLDPSIRALHGPKSIVGRFWDYLAGDRRKTDAQDQTEVKTSAALAGLGRLPSTIPADTFSRALVDTLANMVRQSSAEELKELKLSVEDGSPEEVARAAEELALSLSKTIDAKFKDVAKLIDGLPMPEDLRSKLTRAVRSVSVTQELQQRLDRLNVALDEAAKALQARIDAANVALDEGLEQIGAWFDTSMERVTGWYVRRAKYVLFATGLVLAMAMNFNLIGYAGQLINDDALRSKVVAQAASAIEANAVGGLVVDDATHIALIARMVDRIPAGGVPDRKITEDELTSALAGLTPADRTVLGLPPTGAPDESALETAVGKLNKEIEDIPNFDEDGDQKISPDEAAAAITDTIGDVKDSVLSGMSLIREQLGGDAVPMGWRCGDDGAVRCFLAQGLDAYLSWLIIGLACTMGGHFWFDLLKTLFGARTQAREVAASLQQLGGGDARTGATGGRPGDRE